MENPINPVSQENRSQAIRHDWTFLRGAAVFAVAAVAVVVFVRLGKYLGQRFDFSPPLAAVGLAAPTTFVAAGIAYRVFQPGVRVYHLPGVSLCDLPRVSLYDAPDFVSEEQKKEKKPQKSKEAVFSADYFRNWESIGIRNEKTLHMVAQPESQDKSLEAFRKEWEKHTDTEVPDDIILFANQRLGAVAIIEGWRHLDPDQEEWLPYGNPNIPRPMLEQAYVILADRQVIQGYFQIVCCRQEDNAQERYLNVCVEVSPDQNSTKVYILAESDQPQRLVIAG